jgi:hypothetical protein
MTKARRCLVSTQCHFFPIFRFAFFGSRQDFPEARQLRSRALDFVEYYFRKLTPLHSATAFAI